MIERSVQLGCKNAVTFYRTSAIEYLSWADARIPDSMGLSSQYKRQFGWRDWASVLKDLPRLYGQTVTDLGCGVGDLAAELVAWDSCDRL